MTIPEPGRPRPISGSESLYLDLVRSLAAIVVVLDHVQDLFRMPLLPRLGHEAVVVFFVLSGYVICNTADSRETTLASFMTARLARLWSVLVPALALTVLCDAIGRHFGTNPAVYARINADYPFLRIGAALTFLSETWVSIQPLSNGVIWSLCAEFWYYVLFAAFTFLPRGTARFLALAATALLAGFKALLLLPIWATGVLLQRWQRLRRIGRVAGTLLALGGLAVVVAITTLDIYGLAWAAARHSTSPWLFTQLAQAKTFWLDWIFGLAVAAHFAGMRRIGASLPLEQLAGPIRWAANLSFAAYLFHPPLLYLCASFLSPAQGWLALLITFPLIALLGRPAEGSKGWWRRRLEHLLPVVSRGIGLPWPRGATGSKAH